MNILSLLIVLERRWYSSMQMHVQQLVEKLSYNIKEWPNISEAQESKYIKRILVTQNSQNISNGNLLIKKPILDTLINRILKTTKFGSSFIKKDEINRKIRSFVPLVRHSGPLSLGPHFATTFSPTGNIFLCVCYSRMHVCMWIVWAITCFLIKSQSKHS